MNKVAAISLGESGDIQRQTSDFSDFQGIAKFCKLINDHRQRSRSVHSLLTTELLQQEIISRFQHIVIVVFTNENE